MKASLMLERVGDGYDWQIERARGRAMVNAIAPGLGNWLVGGNPRAVWVAEITGADPRYGLARQFLKPKIDHTHANSAGTRGVYACYTLESGRVYEVRAWRSWRTEDRYFCRVSDDGDIIRITRDEVDAWLSKSGADRSASAS